MSTFTNSWINYTQHETIELRSGECDTKLRVNLIRKKQNRYIRNKQTNPFEVSERNKQTHSRYQKERNKQTNPFEISERNKQARSRYQKETNKQTRSRSWRKRMNMFIRAMRVSRCLANILCSSVLGINSGRSKHIWILHNYKQLLRWLPAGLESHWTQSDAPIPAAE